MDALERAEQERDVLEARIAELEAALRTIATMSVQHVGSGLDWSAGWALTKIEKTARAALQNSRST